MDVLVAWLADNCPSEKQRELWTRDGAVEMVADPASECGDRVLRAKAGLKRNLRLPVPPACVLTLDIVEASDIGKALRGLDRYTLFAVFLVYEQRRGAASFWKPYLDVLPRDILFHPITFLDRQDTCAPLAAALANEKLLLRALESQQEKLRAEFDHARALITMHATTDIPALGECFSQSAPLLYEEFRWASCMVISRAFNMVEPRKVMCMLPFADSMNHNAADPTVQWRPRLPKGFFVVTILRDLSPGEELTANYHGGGHADGPRTQMDDLRNYVMYGFVESNAFADVQQAALLQPSAEPDAKPDM
ncbi:Histone-lysine N-methyltransferase setd3 [Hondaea fermentalgiana]|uniref:Histone-lysine N-methyltransferase setd3 n=1 Tax=Hondaea fermentalgiana TaxID=2315210 RepID=A0A2R5GEX7_9STRA|nr:Histone-lysine N-methyltransferase setd3 [Hondaea fermentalgiana]|eukprot:GBG27153.1 Histone-lysine N-methyltransferase setd3 [Hondaea fermentalgiana]